MGNIEFPGNIQNPGKVQIPGAAFHSPAGRAGLDLGALHGGVALVAGEADAGHGAHGQRVQHLALRVQAARV